MGATMGFGQPGHDGKDLACEGICFKEYWKLNVNYMDKSAFSSVNLFGSLYNFFLLTWFSGFACEISIYTWLARVLLPLDCARLTEFAWLLPFTKNRKTQDFLVVWQMRPIVTSPTMPDRKPCTTGSVKLDIYRFHLAAFLLSSYHELPSCDSH